MNIERITKDRLQGWEKRCNETKSTPQVLVTLNPITAQVGVVIPENLTISQVKSLLMIVLQQL